MSLARKIRRHMACPRLLVEVAPDTFNLTRDAWAIIGNDRLGGSGIVKLIRMAGRHPEAWAPPQMVGALRLAGHVVIDESGLQRMFYLAMRRIYEAHVPGHADLLDFIFRPNGDWGQFDRIIASGSVSAFVADVATGGVSS